MDINDLSKEVEKISKKYTSEFGIKRNAEWFLLKLQEELGELTQSYLRMVGQGRRGQKSKEELDQDFRKEVADVFCHILLLANHYDIDLEKEVEEKWLVWDKKV